MLPHRRYRPHIRLEPLEVERWLHRIDPPRRRTDLYPARARFKLRMVPELLHRIKPSAGDIGGLEALENLSAREGCEYPLDFGLQRRAVLQADRRGGKARVGGKRRVMQHEAAEAGEFALVLHAEEHRAAVAGAERAVGHDGGVVCT